MEEVKYTCKLCPDLQFSTVFARNSHRSSQHQQEINCSYPLDKVKVQIKRDMETGRE